jgi:uncharacterized protein YcnI
VRVGRVVVSCLLGLGLAVVGTQVASAHVTISPNTATQGEDVTLTFQVPNELDAANTTKLEVQLPPDAPFDEVSVQPVAGWTYAVGKQGDTPTTVTWSGGTIKPGEFEQFSIAVGPLPKDQTELAFKALQTYDNGDVVSWIETTTPGGAEPDHPAPVLSLTADSAAATSGGTSVKVDDDNSNTLAVVGIGIGAVAALLAIAALVLNRKRAPS